jgi:hypothetical protein
LGVESEQLLTQRKTFEDEILAGTKGTAKPAEEVPEPHDHGKNLIRQSPSELAANSLILQVFDVLMNGRTG